MLESILAVAIFTSSHTRAEDAPDPAQVRAFKRRHICPGTGNIERLCRGYTVEHIVPIACGGSDLSENMRYVAIDRNKENTIPGCKVKEAPK